MFRQANPSAESLDTILLRHVAQATADVRWLTASPMYEQIPDDFRLIHFPSPGESVKPALESDVEGARAAAAELMGDHVD